MIIITWCRQLVVKVALWATFPRRIIVSVANEMKQVCDISLKHVCELFDILESYVKTMKSGKIKTCKSKITKSSTPESWWILQYEIKTQDSRIRDT